VGLGLRDLFTEGHGAQADGADLERAAAQGNGVHGDLFDGSPRVCRSMQAGRRQGAIKILFDNYFLLFYSKL
jgi:hypothetical protein